jgi:hypothetical protein
MHTLCFMLGVAVAVGGGEGKDTGTDNQIEQVRQVIKKLDGVEAINLSKEKSGAFRVKIRREKGTEVPLNWRDGNQRATHTDWGKELSFVLTLTDNAIRLDCLQNVTTPVSGPFKTRTTYLKSLALEVDRRGTPHYRTKTMYHGLLGRERWREGILTEQNCPGDELLKEMKEEGAFQKLKDKLKSLQLLEKVSIERVADGQYDVTLTATAAKKIDVDKPMVKSIELGKEVSFRLTDDGKEIKLENIKNVKVNAEVLKQAVTVELKSFVLFEEKDGSLAAKAEVTSPLTPGKTMTVPVDLKDLPFGKDDKAK